MTASTRLILILTLILAVAAGAAAQETAAREAATTTTTTTETEAAPGEQTAAAADPKTSREVRLELSRLLEQHPPELANIVRLDPMLLSNEEFLAGYPALARFVADHPEILRNPRYFLGEPVVVRRDDDGPFEEILEGLFIFLIFAFIAFALGWFIRTIIEQKRWNRLSRAQNEVHNKILDRFGSSEELLAYVRTPAGTKFLESAPIPLHEQASPQNAPLARIMWSVQLGVVVAAGALGMLLASLGFSGETRQGLFTMGVIAFCVGAGFIGSAVVSIVMSRRLGFWQNPEDPSGKAVSDPGVVR